MVFVILKIMLGNAFFLLLEVASVGYLSPNRAGYVNNNNKSYKCLLLRNKRFHFNLFLLLMLLPTHIEVVGVFKLGSENLFIQICPLISGSAGQ